MASVFSQTVAVSLGTGMADREGLAASCQKHLEEGSRGGDVLTPGLLMVSSEKPKRMSVRQENVLL